MQDPDDDVVVDAQPESRVVLDSRQEIGSVEIQSHKISSTDIKAEAKSVPNLLAKNVERCQEKDNKENNCKPPSEVTTVKTLIPPTRKKLLFFEDRKYFDLFPFLPNNCNQDDLYENNFDILIINVEEDEDDVKHFKSHLEEIIDIDFKGETFYPRIRLLEEMRDGSNEPLDLAFSKTAFVFIYVTEALCKDSKAVFKGNACLQEALEDENKKKNIITIYTIKKNGIKLPLMLKSLRGIDYWRGKEHPDYVESVRKLFKDKISFLFNRDSDLSKRRNSVIEKYRKEINEAHDFHEKSKKNHEKTSPPITKIVPNEIRLPSASLPADYFETSDSTTICNRHCDGEFITPENSDEAHVLRCSQTFIKTVRDVAKVYDVVPQTNTNTVSQTSTFDNSASLEQYKEDTACASSERIEAGTCHPSSNAHVYKDNQHTHANPVCHTPLLQQFYPSPSQACPQFNHFNNLYGQLEYAPPYGPEFCVHPEPDGRSLYASPNTEYHMPMQPESAVLRQQVFAGAHNKMAHESQFQRNINNASNFHKVLQQHPSSSNVSSSLTQMSHTASYSQGSYILPAIQPYGSDSYIRIPIPVQPGTSGLNQCRDNRSPNPARTQGSIDDSFNPNQGQMHESSPAVRPAGTQPIDLTSIETQSSGYGFGAFDQSL